MLKISGGKVPKINRQVEKWWTISKYIETSESSEKRDYGAQKGVGSSEIIPKTSYKYW